jgi:hypothetical protein
MQAVLVLHTVRSTLSSRSTQISIILKLTGVFIRNLLLPKNAAPNTAFFGVQIDRYVFGGRVAACFPQIDRYADQQSVAAPNTALRCAATVTGRPAEAAAAGQAAVTEPPPSLAAAAGGQAAAAGKEDEAVERGQRSWPEYLIGLPGLLWSHVNVGCPVWVLPRRRSGQTPCGVVCVAQHSVAATWALPH